MTKREIKYKCLYRDNWYIVKELCMYSDGSVGVNSFQEENFSPDSEHIKCMVQYTGLLDKNGKEIYEGYIVKIIDLNQNVIVKSIGINVLRNADDEYFYEPSFHSIFVKAKQNAITITDGSKCEVVGNIYQNQDLLK